MKEVYTVYSKTMQAIIFDFDATEILRKKYPDISVREYNNTDEAIQLMSPYIKKKVYAVKSGIVNGIYFDWNVCKSMVIGVTNSVFKGFTDINNAVQFMIDDNAEAKVTEEKLSTPYAYVDGSYNIDAKEYGYGALLFENGNEHEFYGSGNDESMVSMRNVAGEILGSTRAIKEAINLGLKEITIFYDYQGIQNWAEGTWKRNKKGTIAYYNFIQTAKQVIKINFVKVKAHTGVELNEKVDKLAKFSVGIV